MAFSVNFIFSPNAARFILHVLSGPHEIGDGTKIPLYKRGIFVFALMNLLIVIARIIFLLVFFLCLIQSVSVQRRLLDQVIDSILHDF